MQQGGMQRGRPGPPPERVAVVMTRRQGVFNETRASLRTAGFDRVVHASPQAVLSGPDVFWVMDMRMPDAVELVKRLLGAGRFRGMAVTTGMGMHEIRDVVAGGLPSLLVLAHIEASPVAAGDAGNTLAPLTMREIEVLSAMAEGLSLVDTGQRMGIAERTVKSHLQRIARKLDSRNTAHSVMIAMRAGVLR